MRCSQSVCPYARVHAAPGGASVLLFHSETKVGRVSVYQVLYRKWRPRVFADVVGQPQVTVTLQNELSAGRIAHAYLFTGSRGTGKTTCAKILAKAVNCLNLQNGDPCGECELCRGIDNGSVTDVVEIDAASNNGVDSIRELREEVNFTPAAAVYRVYIIDEVHMLSIGAFNALLKTLEEPPAHVVFILATTEVHKLPATILSRCQRFDFHRIAPEAIAQRLAYVCSQEQATITDGAALMIARLADGALRDALSLLDQCFGRSREVTEQVVIDSAGLAGREHLLQLTDAIADGDTAAILQNIDRLHEASKDMARLCEELISYFRNLMLFKTVKEPRGLMTVGDEEYAQAEQQAHRFTLTSILSKMEALQQCLEAMARGANRRVEMEMTLVRMCEKPPVLPDNIADRLEKLEQAVRNGVPSAVKQPARPQPQRPPKPSAEGLPSAESSAPMAEWPEVLEALHRLSPGLCAFLDDSKAFCSGDFVLIDAPNSMAFEMLRNNPDQKDKMREAIRAVTGKTYRLGPYRTAQSPEKDTEDPLAALAGMAEAVGIPVKENKA